MVPRVSTFRVDACPITGGGNASGQRGPSGGQPRRALRSWSPADGGVLQRCHPWPSIWPRVWKSSRKQRSPPCVRRDPNGSRPRPAALFFGRCRGPHPTGPQSLALLDAGAVDLPPDLRARLAAIEYDRCLAVMAVLDEPSSRIPFPGGLSPVSGPLVWISDNQAKGISPVPAVTLHATAAFSLEHWDRDRTETGLLLIEAAREWIGPGIREFQVHGWRYSRPRISDEFPCMVACQRPPLVLAGDAFGPGGIEGAALSGLAAARAIVQTTSG